MQLIPAAILQLTDSDWAKLLHLTALSEATTTSSASASILRVTRHCTGQSLLTCSGSVGS